MNEMRPMVKVEENVEHQECNGEFVKANEVKNVNTSVDSNAVAAVLQFLQKHNLKVCSYRAS